MPEPQTREDLEAAQAAEYGTYQAVEPIYYDGVLAFSPGHPVPVSHVDAYGYDKQKLVQKVSTASGQPAKTITTEKG